MHEADCFGVQQRWKVSRVASHVGAFGRGTSQAG